MDFEDKEDNKIIELRAIKTKVSIFGERKELINFDLDEADKFLNGRLDKEIEIYHKIIKR